ncbi:MAG TPA: thiol:disulfide interchange protein DsbG, partial [Gammaproteobacteria bacterium]|nr:thiol:disulfide interchange protein DsbG [Gammaproteobacteria bacterium]
ITAFLLTAGAAQAAVYPVPVQTLIEQGVQVEAEFKAPGGLTGYAARCQGQPLALYLTADSKQVIVGTMLDAQGKNLSEAQLETHLPAPDFDSAWPLLEKAHWVREGAADAKRIVYVFTDPNCPYCNAFWRATQPHIGKHLQVRHILVGILAASSTGKAARILAADDPAAALAQHESSHAAGGIQPLEKIPAEIQRKLMANNQLMSQLGAQATPMIFYKDRQGKVRQILGMPPSDVLARDIVQQPAKK